jgi:hypothetical protein
MHLPVERKVRQLVDAQAGAEPLAVIGEAPFGKVGGNGPVFGSIRATIPARRSASSRLTWLRTKSSGST